ncbi:MAG: uroporphyrinogen III decarboxylase [Clostridiales bacterium]|nr:uroporphyrinogen III decarboxylase [Clostridiales bacterium]
MTKKQRVLAAINKEAVDHVPASFSLHFPEEIAAGEAGIQAHLDFFEQTDCDILKIMNENLVPYIEEAKTVADLKRIPAYTRTAPFMQKQLDMIKGILDRAGDEYSIATIHGICASVLHPIEKIFGYDQGRVAQVNFLRENKQIYLEASKRVADAMCELVQASIELGCDGIYYAALGGEKQLFSDEEFAEVIEPFDRQILLAAKEAKGDIFLHICKDNLEMNRYKNYQDICDVLNWGVYETSFSLEEGKALFPNATIMGGLENRSGVFVEGTIEELEAEVRKVIQNFGTTGFILGADCTLPTEMPYERIRAAVHAAVIK